MHVSNSLLSGCITSIFQFSLGSFCSCFSNFLLSLISWVRSLKLLTVMIHFVHRRVLTRHIRLMLPANFISAVFLGGRIIIHVFQLFCNLSFFLTLGWFERALKISKCFYFLDFSITFVEGLIGSSFVSDFQLAVVLVLFLHGDQGMWALWLLVLGVCWGSVRGINLQGEVWTPQQVYRSIHSSQEMWKLPLSIHGYQSVVLRLPLCVL